MEITTLIDRYCEAWSEPDAKRRAELVSAVWAEGATYSDPTVQLTGADALLAHIEGFRAALPDARIVRTSAIDQHHDTARFQWELTSNGKAIVPEGLDLVLLSADGAKLQRVVGFFGPLKRH